MPPRPPSVAELETVYRPPEPAELTAAAVDIEDARADRPPSVYKMAASKMVDRPISHLPEAASVSTLRSNRLSSRSSSMNCDSPLKKVEQPASRPAGEVEEQKKYQVPDGASSAEFSEQPHIQSQQIDMIRTDAYRVSEMNSFGDE